MRNDAASKSELTDGAGRQHRGDGLLREIARARQRAQHAAMLEVALHRVERAEERRPRCGIERLKLRDFDEERRLLEVRIDVAARAEKGGQDRPGESAALDDRRKHAMHLEIRLDRSRRVEIRLTRRVVDEQLVGAVDQQRRQLEVGVDFAPGLHEEPVGRSAASSGPAFSSSVKYRPLRPSCPRSARSRRAPRRAPFAFRMRATRARAPMPVCRMNRGRTEASHLRPSGSNGRSDDPDPESARDVARRVGRELDRVATDERRQHAAVSNPQTIRRVTAASRPYRRR